MASKFVAAVALLALCHANPVLINGILYRDGRAYSVGQASSYGGGVSTAQAKANDHTAQAFSSATGGAQLARDGYYYPGQASAQAQAYDAPPFLENAYGAAKAVTQNSAYYPVPAPATVITYEQNFAPAESSVSHAASHGGGDAHSSAETHGRYGATSSNTHTQGLGSADSTAKSDFGSTSSFAKSNGEGSAVSSAQNNGFAGVVYPAASTVLADQPSPTVVDLRTPTYYTSYVPSVPAGVASSNAYVVGGGHATSSAKIGHGQGRTISWRFGTLYDNPTSAQAQASTHPGQGAAAKSAAHTYYHGNGRAQSSANSQGDGSANANASVNSAGYYGARSTDNGLYYGGSRSSSDAHTQGSGSAVSSTWTQNGKATNSQANSSGFGSASANALAV